MMINKLLKFKLLNVLFCFSLFILQTKGQDMNHVKETISNLCSEQFKGRGYTHKGDSLASDYIAKLLKKNKVKSFPGGYFQPFSISVNTFPGMMKIAINDSVIIPGYDYLVSSTTNTIKGTFPIIVLDKNIVDFPERFKTINTDSISKSFVLIDTLLLKNKGFRDAANDMLNYNLLGAKGVIEVENKNLMYSPSPVVFPFPKIYIQRNSLFEEMKTISVSIENEYYKAYTTRNIIGFIPGKIDSFIVFTAHYDHLGEMGKGIYFPGANDNASGTAMLTELAKYFVKNKRKLDYSIAFIFFSAEELGLLGSTHYSENPVFPLSKIKFLVNLDMVGSGDKGIMVVNGTEHKQEFQKLVNINNINNYLPKIMIRGPRANSDHFPFHQKGVKAFFIYTEGEYSEYHSIYDKPEDLPLSEFSDLYKLLIDFYKSFNSVAE